MFMFHVSHQEQKDFLISNFLKSYKFYTRQAPTWTQTNLRILT